MSDNDSNEQRPAFRVFSSNGRTRILRKNVDLAAGPLGTISTPDSPVGEAQSLESIREIGYAFLGRDASADVYVTDSNNRILEILQSDKYWGVVFSWWVFVFFCIVIFLATLILGISQGGLAIFIVMSAIYLTMVRLNIQNEIESAVVCTIILVLFFLLVPGIKQAYKNHIQKKPIPVIHRAVSQVSHQMRFRNFQR